MSSNIIELHLPILPPSVNSLWRIGRGKRLYLSKKAKQWREDMRILALSQIRANKYQKIEGSWEINLLAVRPDRRKRDLDNALKSLLDFLVSLGIVDDDSHVEAIHARWVTEGEGVYIRLQPAAIVGTL